MSIIIERIERIGVFVKAFYLIFIVFAVAYGGSCTQPLTSDLGSERDDEDGDDNGDRQNASTCSDRDSCQDICDEIFDHTTERYDCYDLGASEVNTVTNVADALYDADESDLEDLSIGDVRAFFEIGMESFIDLVKGDQVGDGDSYHWDTAKRKGNSEVIMKWIAEDEDIAKVILEQDRNFELGLELFQAVGTTVDTAYQVYNDSDDTKDLHVCLEGANKDMVNYGPTASCGTKLLDLVHFTGVEKFLSGFLSQSFSNDSFMTFSADERNDAGFEWGHNTLLEFCKEATDEDESDVEVKTCLQTAYCVHRKVEGTTGDGIFKDLDDYDDIVGRTDVDRCADLTVKRRMEDLFD